MRNYSKMVKTGNIERHCNSFLCAVVILCFLSTKKYKCGKKSVVKIKKSHKPQSQSDNDLACGFLITLIYKLVLPPASTSPASAGNTLCFPVQTNHKTLSTIGSP